ncbi:hypothetical protein [Kitasatospora sp. MBT66]|uniref:hypothetical protein n=1 Tax=Kitasatospora sp. MBT66 TaxID=1444769 RepID=UPI0005BC7082|nr:hypothetical protein [Kitasatospora sp. MBT66]
MSGTTPTEYHWIATLQWAWGGHTITSTGDGIVDVTTKRRAVYKDVIAHARVQMQVPPGAIAAVLFFSLEPNDMG